MRLLNPESLADDLETGIGNVSWYYELIPKELRLRLPVCEMVSVAIANVLREQNHRVAMVQTTPELGLDPSETHVFPVVHDIGKTPTVIDATYGSFLRLTGLTPEGILAGQKNNYPDEKILAFDRNDTRRAAILLATKGRIALRQWQPSSGSLSQQPAFYGLELKEIYHRYSEFWNPAHFKLFEPSQETIDTAARITEAINPVSLQLIGE